MCLGPSCVTIIMTHVKQGDQLMTVEQQLQYSLAAAVQKRTAYAVMHSRLLECRACRGACLRCLSQQRGLAAKCGRRVFSRDVCILPPLVIG